jgi:hypothetical protein
MNVFVFSVFTNLINTGSYGKNRRHGFSRPYAIFQWCGLFFKLLGSTGQRPPEGEAGSFDFIQNQGGKKDFYISCLFYCFFSKDCAHTGLPARFFNVFCEIQKLAACCMFIPNPPTRLANRYKHPK